MHKHLPTRWDSKGAWYFVTAVTRNRVPYFQDESSCRIFLHACHSVRERHPYRLGALVIMPDHWHALIKPLEHEVIESIVGSIKQRVFHASRQNAAISPQGKKAAGGAAFHGGETASTPGPTHPQSIGGAAFHGGAHKAQGRSAPPKIIRWQTRFMDHRIRDEDDYYRHLEYMRLNPWRRGLVADEKTPWPWWFVHEDPFG